jgi:predicted nucleic acid-binding protein
MRSWRTSCIAADWPGEWSDVEKTPARVLAMVMAVVEMVSPNPLPMPPDLRDPDDLILLECAKAAGAEAIITGDKDLLTLKKYEGIPIITAREALEKLGIPAE